MIKKNFITAVSLAIFILALGVPMNIHAGQDKGDSSVTLSGGFFHTQGSDMSTFNLEAGYGYFLTQGWELGVQQSLGLTRNSGEKNEWIASTIPFINYNFQGLSTNDSFVPFLGAFIGASYNSNDITGTVGPQVGFKSFVNDRTFIMVKYRYEWFFDDITINDFKDQRSDGNHAVTIGLGFTF